MNRLPVPCFGVGCERYKDCYRYALIEGSSPREVRMSLCGEPGKRILFQPFPLAEAGDRRGTVSLTANGRRTT